jgi:hypothetical protein
MKTEQHIYVRPTAGEFEVVKTGHRRGPTFASQELAINRASDHAATVLVLNRTGKVEREVQGAGDLDDLVAAYYAALGGEGKDRDGHWSVAQRWSYGEYEGWFVEHLGFATSGGPRVDDDEGPFSTPEEARRAMAATLRAAIERVRGG